MKRLTLINVFAAGAVAAAALSSACSSADAQKKQTEAAPLTVAVAPAPATQKPIARFIRVTGTLNAEEQASVAAETAGRVVSTPVERGTVVVPGSELIRISSVDTEASVQEAEANAAQIQARLGLGAGGTFDVAKVPEVANARAGFELAQADFNRISALLDQKVVSQAEFDQKRTAVEAARQQYESAKNAAEQQFQSLQAARARVAIARKALGDTVIRAPFSGLVGERLVAVGDYVNKGMKVATVVRVTPLRVELTVPEQFVSAVGVGAPVTLAVDAYPGRTFEGKIRYVSPALRADQRALTVEAVVPNDNRELKPGMFVTAQIQQVNETPAILVPADAVAIAGGTSRVYVITGDRAEERVVTTGQKAGDLIEITNGLKAGEQVATKNVGQLVDGAKVSR